MFSIEGWKHFVDVMIHYVPIFIDVNIGTIKENAITSDTR